MGLLATIRQYKIYSNQPNAFVGIAPTPIVGTGALHFKRQPATDASCFNVVRTTAPNRLLNGFGYLFCRQTIIQQTYLDIGYYCCAQQEDVSAAGLPFGSAHCYAGALSWRGDATVFAYLADFPTGLESGTGTDTLPSGTLTTAPLFPAPLGALFTLALAWIYSPVLGGLWVRLWVQEGTGFPPQNLLLVPPVLQRTFPLLIAPVPMAEGEFCRITRFDATNECIVDNVGRFQMLVIGE